ncbi:hypothetical protein [Thermodesulfobacterium hydrogeniphilum]|uniref:hypothetical protein n=1 Tax=Thermodesulfobacterium hydrogeniphilum TaxID=161156 RepID=UPI0012EC5642|nr:hypothetical protein [Thermodesulfobacterium hydrogeniphilum]
MANKKESFTKFDKFKAYFALFSLGSAIFLRFLIKAPALIYWFGFGKNKSKK